MIGVALNATLHWDLSIRAKKVKKALLRVLHWWASLTMVTRYLYPNRVALAFCANAACFLGGLVGLVLSASRTVSKSDCDAWTDKVRDGSGKSEPVIHLWSCDQDVSSQGVLALCIVLGPPILSTGQ